MTSPPSAVLETPGVGLRKKIHRLPVVPSQERWELPTIVHVRFFQEPATILLSKKYFFARPPRVCPMSRAGPAYWCGRWDLNTRTPTGQAPQACASKTLREDLFDLAWQHGRHTSPTPANARLHPAQAKPPATRPILAFPSSTRQISIVQIGNNV